MKIKRIIVILLVIISLGGLGVYAYNNLNIKTSKVVFLKGLEKNDVNTTKSSMPKKSIRDGEKEIQLEYKETKYDTDIYVSNDKNEYMYKDNKVVGFIKSIDKDIKTTKLDLEDAEKIAKAFLQENISENQKYELTFSNYITSYAEHSFIYNNKLNGIETNDIIKVNVNNKGEVVSFSHFNEGVFEKFNNIEIDMTAIEKEVEDMIKSEYGQNYVNSEITYSFLNIVNNKLVMQMDVNIEIANQLQASILDTVIYELN